MTVQHPTDATEQPHGSQPAANRRGSRTGFAVTVGALGALAVVAIGIGAYAIGHQGATAPRPGTISVDAVATRQIAPNTVTFSVGISAKGSNAAKALHLDDTRATLLTNELHAIGVPLSGIRTINVSVSPDYANGGGIADYSATNEVTVTLHGLSLTSKAISTSFEIAGNGIQFTGPTYSITGDRAAYAQVRAEAVRNAKDKATELAQGAGGSIGNVVSISEQENAPAPSYPIYQDHVFAAYANARAIPSVPVSAGTQQISVSVSVAFTIA